MLRQVRQVSARLGQISIGLSTLGRVGMLKVVRTCWAMLVPVRPALVMVGQVRPG